MGRFDRDETPEIASLGSATEDLRAAVEEKLYEIVEAAEARAHELEDQALEQALELEQDAERRARERFTPATDGGEQLLTAIDAFERDVARAIAAFRERGEALLSELDAATGAAPAGGDETVPSGTVEPQPPAPPTAPEDVREQVRRRILDLFLAGKPRVEAERMLTQLDDGGRYVDLLDEVYEARAETQQGSRRRRGGRRRRRPGAH